MVSATKLHDHTTGFFLHIDILRFDPATVTKLFDETATLRPGYRSRVEDSEDL
jgi:hypothetical protein